MFLPKYDITFLPFDLYKIPHRMQLAFLLGIRW